MFLVQTCGSFVRMKLDHACFTGMVFPVGGVCRYVRGALMIPPSTGILLTSCFLHILEAICSCVCVADHVLCLFVILMSLFLCKYNCCAFFFFLFFIQLCLFVYLQTNRYFFRY